MNLKAEEIASRCLRKVLKPLSAGASIEDSREFSEFQTALERVIPAAFARAYDYWRYEGLDGFRFAVARKLGLEEAEFVGLCLLVGNQTWIPLYVRMRLAQEMDEIERLECKVGESRNDDQRVAGTPYGSNRETKLLYSVVDRLESISWAYTISQSSSSDAG